MIAQVHSNLESKLVRLESFAYLYIPTPCALQLASHKWSSEFVLSLFFANDQINLIKLCYNTHNLPSWFASTNWTSLEGFRKELTSCKEWKKLQEETRFVRFSFKHLPLEMLTWMYVKVFISLFTCSLASLATSSDWKRRSLREFSLRARAIRLSVFFENSRVNLWENFWRNFRKRTTERTSSWN